MYHQIGCSLNLSPNSSQNLSPNLVITKFVTKFGDKFVTKFVTKLHCAHTSTPAISQHGQTLVSLSLAEVGQIDVGLLATLCPALVHLSLLWNSQYLVGNSIPPDFFPKLRTAELSCREREDEEDMLEPPQDQLAIILSSPMLTSLKLSNSANLTDIFVSNLLVSPNSCLQLLQTLHLTRCNEVTMDGLGPLLLAHNHLDSAAFSKCEEIGLADFQEYQRKAKKLKWSIQLLWS